MKTFIINQDGQKKMKVAKRAYSLFCNDIEKLVSEADAILNFDMGKSDQTQIQHLRQYIHPSSL